MPKPPVQPPIRPARVADLPGVIELDAETTGLAKPEYWHELFRRHRGPRGAARADPADAPGHFLVAVEGPRIVGFIVGAVRAWEFGSPPCGWIYAVQVRAGLRLGGVGSALFAAICAAFRADGVDRVRTMLAREDSVIHAFFRGQGMTAGPFIQLETRLD